MPYAAQTRVPISRTKTDIEELLAKHGATGFAYATEGDRALVAFSMSGRRVQIAPLQVEGFGLAKRCAPEQQSEEPRLSGRHGVQDHLHLVGGPVVEESSRGHEVSLEWQTSVQSLPCWFCR